MVNVKKCFKYRNKEKEVGWAGDIQNYDDKELNRIF